MLAEYGRSLGLDDVGLDRGGKVVIFANTISLYGLDQARFSAFVAAGVDLIDAWRKLVESDSFPRAVAGSSDDLPTINFGTGMHV